MKGSPFFCHLFFTLVKFDPKKSSPERRFLAFHSTMAKTISYLVYFTSKMIFDCWKHPVAPLGSKKVGSGVIYGGKKGFFSASTSKQ